jgi:hypothetical protein
LINLFLSCDFIILILIQVLGFINHLHMFLLTLRLIDLALDNGRSTWLLEGRLDLALGRWWKVSFRHSLRYADVNDYIWTKS